MKVNFLFNAKMPWVLGEHPMASGYPTGSGGVVFEEGEEDHGLFHG